jgi:isopenicillin-N epimerase
MAKAREALGAFVGAAADDLVYVPNATTGINIVVRSLPLEPGDQILATNHEYGALDRAWRFTCRKRGATYIRQPVCPPIESAEQVIEAVWRGVTERTRVLYISHITSPTALLFPVAELVRRARAAGIITVVDGAHAPGQTALDLRVLDADFYAGNCHKWMLSPKGSGFLYARREMQPLLEPLVVSWGWESEMPGDSRFIDEQEYQGTRDLAAHLSVPDAIRFMQQHDWPAVGQACHDLLLYARDRILDRTGLPPLVVEPSTTLVQMAAFALPAVDGRALQRQLYDHFAIEIPIFEWEGRPYLRISIQGYNTRDDVDCLVTALGELLPVHGVTTAGST